MRMRIVLALVAVIGLGMAASPSLAADKTEKKPAVATAEKTYICPMHKEVTSDKPGKCSKCGMDLVLKKEKEAPKSDQKSEAKDSCCGSKAKKSQ